MSGGDDLFGSPPPAPRYERPDPYSAPRSQQRPGPPPPRPLIPGAIKACDLKPGILVRVEKPRSMGRVISATRDPSLTVHRTIGGGDPQPAIRVVFLFMDGERRGQRDEAQLHPEDQIRLGA